MIASKKGFTIVETMIFLAISGVTFVMAVTILGNQQRSTQFNQSVRDFESSLNDIANDTATGFFPEVKDVKCEVASGNISFIDSPGTSSGENIECVYIGKVVQLFDGDTAGINPNYLVHTLVGVNRSASTSFIQTDPVPFHESVGTGNAIFGDSAINNLSIPWETNIKRAYYFDGTDVVYVRGLAYVYSNFGNRISDETFQSGAASIGLYAVVDDNNPTSEIEAKNMTNAGFIDSINTQGGATNPSKYESVKDIIYVCLEGVGGKQSMIEIGSVSGSVSARTNFDVTAECRAPAI